MITPGWCKMIVQLQYRFMHDKILKLDFCPVAAAGRGPSRDGLKRGTGRETQTETCLGGEHFTFRQVNRTSSASLPNAKVGSTDSALVTWSSTDSSIRWRERWPPGSQSSELGRSTTIEVSFIYEAEHQLSLALKEFCWYQCNRLARKAAEVLAVRQC